MKIEHKVVIDILELNKDISTKVRSIENDGYYVKGILINPETLCDIIVNEDYRVYSLHTNLFGYEVFPSNKINKMEYCLLIE